jgi:4-carboxymuconolactone decarboxylase
MEPKDVGEQIMGDLMGADYLEHRKTQGNDFNDVLQDYSAEVCFGRVWARPGLDRKLRRLIDVVALVALNRPNQLRNHLEGRAQRRLDGRGDPRGPPPHRGLLWAPWRIGSGRS